MRLNWYGACYGTTGYANSGRGLILALDKRGVDIQLYPKDRHKKEKKMTHDLEKLAWLEKELIKSPRIHVFHDVPNQFKPHKKDWNVGLTYWETTRIPTDWVKQCNKMDQIILFSELNRTVFRESGVTIPIDVVPSGISLHPASYENLDILAVYKILNKGFTNVNQSIKDRFTFLSISQWIPRKGLDILLQAYTEEFSRKDNVLLIIKTKRSKTTSNKMIYREVAQYTACADSPEVIVYAGELYENQMSLLYQISDAYVLPARGEGVGLPYLEAGSMGLPVIATAWGGQMDFLNEENSYLINYSLSPAKYTECSIYFSEDQDWAEPNKEHLKSIMRHVYENSKEGRVKGSILQKQILDKHNWNRAAGLIQDFIEQIMKPLKYQRE